MFKMKALAVLLTMVGALHAIFFAPMNIKSKCQAIQTLRNAGAHEQDLSDWLCLIEKESGYQYNLRQYNDSGIFQLNNIWCDRPSGYSGTTCWMLLTYGCADKCDSFLDADISNDAYCAVRIRQCQGFGAWFRWRDYCHNVTSAAYDYSEC